MYPPNDRASIDPPRIYVHRPVHWEYRRLTCDLDRQPVLDEARLNELGEDGWELAAIAPVGQVLHYYFKRVR